MWKIYLTPKNIVIGIIQFIQAIATVVFITALLKINILPTKYIVLIGIISAIMFVVTMLIQIHNSWKKYIGTVISIVITVLLLIGTLLVSKTDTTMNSMINSDEYFDQIIVITLSDSSIENLNDTNNKKVGVQHSQQPELMLASEKRIQVENDLIWDTIVCDTIIGQVYALLNKEVDAIIYNDAYTDLFLEQMPDFNQKVKVIYKCEMKASDIDEYKDMIIDKYEPDIVIPEETIHNKTPETTIPENTNNEIFTVYLSGIDVYGSITKNSRSDVNIIAIVNTTDNKILLVTTPRDFFVPIPGISGGKNDKLTHAGIYGIEASMNTLSALYDVNLDYYVRVNFTSFETIVDALGGISVYSEYNFNTGGYHYVKGYNELDGKEALAFVRERYSFASGDNQRGKNQQEAIKAIIEKMCSPSILTSINQILDSIRDNVDMNIPEKLIQSLIKKQLDNGKEWKIVTMAATGTGATDEPYSMPGFNAYVMVPNQDSVNSIKEAIQDMFEP